MTECLLTKRLTLSSKELSVFTLASVEMSSEHWVGKTDQLAVYWVGICEVLSLNALALVLKLDLIPLADCLWRGYGLFPSSIPNILCMRANLEKPFKSLWDENAVV